MKQTYQGSCHCGKTQFEINAQIDSARICNCSICLKRGALIFRVEEEDFRLKTSLSDLTLYEWHTKTGKDYFCPGCGILPFRRPSALTSDELKSGMKPFSGWAINLRCLEGIELDNLKLNDINGAGLE